MVKRSGRSKQRTGKRAPRKYTKVRKMKRKKTRRRRARSKKIMKGGFG